MLILGIDEVGRGAWAGPLVIGAVVAEPAQIADRLRRRGADAKGDFQLTPGQFYDSKALSARRRAGLGDELSSLVQAVGIGVVQAEEVDSLGMSEALRLGAQRACETVGDDYDICHIDGPVVYMPWEMSQPPKQVVSVISGDSACVSIAAASIFAKLYRDSLMARLANDVPMFDFEHNVGYPSPKHLQALAIWGPTPYHRVTWAPLRGHHLHNPYVNGRLR